MAIILNHDKPFHHILMNGIFRMATIIITIPFLILIIMGIRDAFDIPSVGITLNNNFTVTEIIPDSAAAQAGIRLGDRVIAIGGDPVTEGDRIAAIGRSLSVGSQLTYSIIRSENETLDLTLTWTPPTLTRKLSILSNGVASMLLLFIASWLNLRKIRFEPAIIFYFLAITYIFFRMDHPRWQNETASRLYQVIYLFGFFILPALFGHFCGRFPKKNFFLYHKKGRIFWLYSPSFILFVPAAIVNWTHFKDVKATSLITAMILFQGVILWGIYLTVGSLMMMRSFIRIRSRVLSRRISIVFYTLFLAVMPYFIHGIMDLIDKSFDYLNIISILLFLPFPLTLAWAIDYGEDPNEGLPWLFNQAIFKSDS